MGPDGTMELTEALASRLVTPISRHTRWDPGVIWAGGTRGMRRHWLTANPSRGEQIQDNISPFIYVWLLWLKAKLCININKYIDIQHCKISVIFRD